MLPPAAAVPEEIGAATALPVGLWAESKAPAGPTAMARAVPAAFPLMVDEGWVTVLIDGPGGKPVGLGAMGSGGR